MTMTMTRTTGPDVSPLARHLTLRSGLVLANRFAKAATSEKLATRSMAGPCAR
jgi:hypothetical protein